MIGLATTTVDVYRDADADKPVADRDVNWFGDEVETPAGENGLDAPILARVPFSLIERTQRVPTDGDLNTVRYVVGRATGGTPIVEGDRLVDRRDGYVYRVDGWSEPQNFGIRLDRKFELVATGQRAAVQNVDPVPAPGGGDGTPADPDVVQAMINVHVNDTTPHPAYDDLPSLRLLFENGLV